MYQPGPAPLAEITVERLPVGRRPRVAAKQLGRGQREPGENRRGPKGGRGLPLTGQTVADVEGQGLGEGRLELDGFALAGRVLRGVWCW